MYPIKPPNAMLIATLPTITFSVAISAGNAAPPVAIVNTTDAIIPTIPIAIFAHVGKNPDGSVYCTGLLRQ